MPPTGQTSTRKRATASGLLWFLIYSRETVLTPTGRSGTQHITSPHSTGICAPRGAILGLELLARHIPAALRVTNHVPTSGKTCDKGGRPAKGRPTRRVIVPRTCTQGQYCNWDTQGRRHVTHHRGTWSDIHKQRHRHITHLTHRLTTAHTHTRVSTRDLQDGPPLGRSPGFPPPTNGSPHEEFSSSRLALKDTPASGLFKAEDV